ncbi:hypothetical protein AMTR_s00268p00008570 [Amborella trichopoda]|uniref:Uncharacterized protein n=1 Tax=Amborella trichopoda TaxID=13333 RepID=W1PAK6_AMBTC|nr:hypothetical protein AMTR_s00268p00008570 [Amborella trichopoda]
MGVKRVLDGNDETCGLYGFLSSWGTCRVSAGTTRMVDMMEGLTCPSCVGLADREGEWTDSGMGVGVWTVVMEGLG